MAQLLKTNLLYKKTVDFRVVKLFLKVIITSELKL